LFKKQVSITEIDTFVICIFFINICVIVGRYC